MINLKNVINSHRHQAEPEVQEIDEQDHVHRNCSVLQSSADWWLSKMAFKIQCAGCHELIEANLFQEHLMNQ